MIPWFQYNVVYLGPLPLQVWGFFVACGIALSLILLYRFGKKKGFDPSQLLDHAVWIIIVGLIFSRIFHIVFYEPAFYISNPLEIIKIWHGGLSSYGGFVGAIIGFFLFAKKRKIDRKKFLKISDLVGWTAIFGWIIARVGCFMIHDHMGKPCDCFLAINTPDGPRLEMAFLEILALLPLAILFIFLRNKKMPEGWFISVLAIYYGITRFVLDFFRATDIAQADARYFGLTPAQYFSMVAFGFGVYMYSKIKKRKK